MTQQKYILRLLKKNPKSIVVGSLGTICYDLKQIEHGTKILITGAMGCAMGVALGIALNTNRKVICLIGDGSYMMKQGSVNTIMAYKPSNLEVHVMVNSQYASTGGQAICPISRPTRPYFKFVKV